MSELIRCDAPRCDHQAKLGQMLIRWFHLEGKSEAWDLIRDGIPSDGLDFCSLECVADWIRSRGVMPIVDPLEVTP